MYVTHLAFHGTDFFYFAVIFKTFLFSIYLVINFFLQATRQSVSSDDMKNIIPQFFYLNFARRYYMVLHL